MKIFIFRGKRAEGTWGGDGKGEMHGEGQKRDIKGSSGLEVWESSRYLRQRFRLMSTALLYEGGVVFSGMENVSGSPG